MNLTRVISMLKADLPILITGESGAGKTFMAKQLHQSAFGKDRIFHHLNVATLSESLIESELFGHVKGAFTGATCDKMGRIELAARGTLFIDEIGELSLSVQKKLLEVLDDGYFTPVGGTAKRRFQGVIISATNCDLPLMVEKGTFRKDLYYRLKGGSVQMPKLIERSVSEFKELVRSLGLTDEGDEFEKLVSEMREYHWPGNIRELRYCIKWLNACKEGSFVTCKDFTLWKSEFALTVAASKSSHVNTGGCYHNAMGEFERDFLVCALREHNGKINETARKIALNKVTFLAKLRLHGIRVNPDRVVEIQKVA